MSTWEDSGMTRKAYTLRGDGMVTVSEPCRIDGDMCVPGIHRFAPDYPAVAEAPKKFVPAYPKDTVTRSKLERLRTVAKRHTTRFRSRPVRSSGKEPWRL